MQGRGKSRPLALFEILSTFSPLWLFVSYPIEGHNASTCAKSENERGEEGERHIDSYHATRRISIYSPAAAFAGHAGGLLNLSCAFSSARPHHPSEQAREGRREENKEKGGREGERAEWNNKPSNGQTDRRTHISKTRKEKLSGSPTADVRASASVRPSTLPYPFSPLLLSPLLP